MLLCYEVRFIEKGACNPLDGGESWEKHNGREILFLLAVFIREPVHKLELFDVNLQKINLISKKERKNKKGMVSERVLGS